MSDKSVQDQINEINRKLDLLLDEASIQRQSRESVDDLIDDVAIIGKDAFKQMVIQLDDAGIELDGEALKNLIFRFIRNIESMGTLLETLESFNDLAKDVTPIIKQIGLDGVKKFHELEQKGYFEILNQLATTIDTIVSRYNLNDIKELSPKLIAVTDTLIGITDPGVLDKINAITRTLKTINPAEIEEYSVWKLMRELNKPEVKKSIGFLMTLLKGMNSDNSKIKYQTN